MAIRAALVEGEQSGDGNKTVDEIWREAEHRLGAHRYQRQASEAVSP